MSKRKSSRSSRWANGETSTSWPARLAATLAQIGTVHFARFVFLGETHLAVITTYDGKFDDYILAFTEKIGDVFDAILKHVKNAPPLPVKQHPAEFLKYVEKYDLKCVPPFYSAYPNLPVRKIVAFQRSLDEEV